MAEATLTDEGILAHVKAVTPHFQNRLLQLRAFDIVGDTRGMGLLGCIEANGATLDAERHLGALLDEACEKRGLLVRPLINMAVFSPPLIISLEEIDEMFDILTEALEDVSQQLGRPRAKR